MSSWLQRLNIMPKKCPYQGERVNCPFVQDVHNPNKYVCVECGRQCSVDGLEIRRLLGWLVKWLVRGILLLDLFD